MMGCVLPQPQPAERHAREVYRGELGSTVSLRLCLPPPTPQSVAVGTAEVLDLLCPQLESGAAGGLHQRGSSPDSVPYSSCDLDHVP